MSSQARGPTKLEAGAGGSPPGPDSTWEAETTFSKMDDKMDKILTALEKNNKLIIEQTEKMAEQENTIQQLQEVVDSRFKELSCKVTGLSKGGMKTPAITKKEDEVEDDGSTREKVEQIMELCQTTDNTIKEKIIPVLTKLEGANALGLVEKLNEKLDMLLTGDEEANKLMEDIIPNIEKIKEQISNVSGGKSDSKSSEDVAKIKSTVEKIYRNQKDDNTKDKIKELGHDLGDIMRSTKDMKDIVKDVRDDMEENTKKVEENTKRAITRGKVLDNIEKLLEKKKKANSDSDSSDDERSHRSRSRDRGSKLKRSRSVGRSGSANSGISKTKEREFENLLTQINSSIEILSNRINKVCPSESIEVTLLPSINKIERNLGIMMAGGKGGVKGDPGTLDSGSGTKWTYDDRGKRREVSDGEDSLAKKLKKKKKRRNSGSSSDNESDEDKGKEDEDFGRQIALIGTHVYGMKEKIDTFVKTNKKSCKTMEDSNKIVLDRVGEMTVGMQVIAENLDSVNDVSKKIETLDGIGTMSKKIDNLDAIGILLDRMAGIPKALDKLDNLTGIEERLAMLPGMERSMINMLQLVTEQGGRTGGNMDGDGGLRSPRRPRMDGGGLEAEELLNIQAQIKKMQADIPTQIGGFGSLVESLHSEMVNKVDKLSTKVTDRVGGSTTHPLIVPKLEDIIKRLKRVENINSAFADNDIKMIGTLKTVEKTLKENIVPFIQFGGGGATSEGGNGGGGVSEARLAGLLSAIQPKLDDLYIRVLPTLEEIKASQKNELKSRQRDDERENVRSREDSDHIQKILDTVEDLKEERPTSLDRRLSEGLGGGGGDMEGRNVRKLEQILQEHGGKMDHVINSLTDLRSCTAKEANFGRMEHKLEEAIHGGMGRLEPDLLNKMHSKINNILNNFNKEDKEVKKVLDGVNELRSNSSSDAKTLSQVNTALQGMKAAASSQDKKMTTVMSSVEEKIDNIFKVGEEGEKNPLDEILAKREEELVSSVEKMLTKMEDEMYENVEKAVGKVGDRMTKTVGTTEEAINEELNKIMEKLNSVNTKAARVAARDTGASPSKEVKKEKDETDNENVDKVVSNLCSQMDDVHDMIAGVEERIVTALKDVKFAVTSHDKNVAGSINKVAVLQRKVVEEMTKAAIGAGPEISAELTAIEERLGNVIKEEREKVKEGNSGVESTQKLDAMSNKIDKLAKNIIRVKYLVDATDEESDGGGVSKKGGFKKKGKADDAVVKNENSLDEAKMEALLGALEKRQGDLFTEGSKSQDKALQDLKKSISEVTKKLGTLEEGVTGVNVCLEEDLSGTGDTLADILKRVENINENIAKQNEGLDKVESKMATSAALEKIDGRMATSLALDRMSGKILCKIENSSGISSSGGGGGGGGIGEEALGEIVKKISEISDPIGEVLKKMSDISDPLAEVVKKIGEMSDSDPGEHLAKKIDEISEKVATGKALENTFNDMMDLLEKVHNGILEIPNDFGSQAAALEENLCVNVVTAVKDANKDNWTYLFNQMDHFEGRLAIVKKYCKYGRVKGGSKGGAEVDNEDDEEDTLDTVVKDIQRVSAKLEDLSKAMENGVTDGNDREASPVKGPRDKMSMTLLLTEIRKKAEKDSVDKLHTDMSKSFHNVQRRLLEEQSRLVKKLSADAVTPTNVTLLIDCLNKVRQSQATILEGQEKSMTTQSDLNKVLGSVITTIEESHKLLDSKQNKGGQMIGRFADLCDELANAISLLVTLQEQTAAYNSNSMESLDDMLTKARSIPLTTQIEGRKRSTSQVGGRGSPPAKRRSLRPSRSSQIADNSEDQGEESGDESAADTSTRTSTSNPVKLSKMRRSGRMRASKEEENDNTEKDSESTLGDDIEIVDEINSGPPMVYKVRDELEKKEEKGEKLKTELKKKDDKEPKGGRKK